MVRLIWADRTASVIEISTLCTNVMNKKASRNTFATTAEDHIRFQYYQARTGIWRYRGHRFTETRKRTGSISSVKIKPWFGPADESTDTSGVLEFWEYDERNTLPRYNKYSHISWFVRKSNSLHLKLSLITICTHNCCSTLVYCGLSQKDKIQKKKQKYNQK